MNGANEGIAMPQRQSQIEPRMKTLIVDHVWCESVYLAKDFPNGLKLAKGLPQSGALEGEKPHGAI
jgi:hypothetical protein